MPVWLSVLIGSVSVIVGLTTIAGVAWRRLILPNLKADLIDPIRRTEHQVTANSHTSATPTIPDRLDDLTNCHRDLEAKVDDHLNWSHEYTSEMGLRVTRLENRIR